MWDLAAAEKQLVRLDKLCIWGCEELDDLKSPVKKYRANNSI